MKKTFIWVLLALLSGALLGKYVFDRYEKVDIKNVISYDNELYFLKYKDYSSEDDMAEDMSDFDRYIFINQDGVVTSYLAIAKTKVNILKIKDIYSSKNINLEVKKISIDNDEFIQNINEYEKLLDAVDDEKSLLIIENQILSCYEDVVVNGK